jgi:hypothetical protein
VEAWLSCFGSAKVALLSKAVRAACDDKDGIVDGVVSNHAACTSNPAVLACPGGTDAGDTCLSKAQLAVVNAWTAPVNFSGGAYTNPGWSLTGNEEDPRACVCLLRMLQGTSVTFTGRPLAFTYAGAGCLPDRGPVRILHCLCTHICGKSSCSDSSS